jgi:hypothetical protein
MLYDQKIRVGTRSTKGELRCLQPRFTAFSLPLHRHRTKVKARAAQENASPAAYGDREGDRRSSFAAASTAPLRLALANLLLPQRQSLSSVHTM